MSHFFTREFHPSFRGIEYGKSKNKKDNTKPVRKMICWAHYQFHQRLAAKAEELGPCYYPK